MIRYGRAAVAAAIVCVALAACGSDNDEPAGEVGLEVVEGPPTAASAGDTLPQPIVVRVVDEAGVARAGQAVAWDIHQGGGALEVPSTTSDADGLVSARWVLGPRVGRNRLGVRVLDQPALILETKGAAFQPDRISAGLRAACGIKDQQVWCWSESFRNEANDLRLVARFGR